MIEKERELLFKDLCARLPYGVKCRQHKLDSQVCTLCPEYLKDFDAVEEFEPYLRPMESMTKKEKKELLNYVVGEKAAKYFIVCDDGNIKDKNYDGDGFKRVWVNFNLVTTSRYVNWLNKKMFDYNGLIPMGVSIRSKKRNV